MNNIRIRCKHSAEAPQLDVFSVFENQYGEQWLAAMRDGDLVIAVGIMAWRELVVPREQLRNWTEPWSTDVSMDRGEQLWVTAVLEVARRRAAR